MAKNPVKDPAFQKTLRGTLSYLRSAGLRAAIKFQRGENLISVPACDNPIPADAPTFASAGTTARSGGTREASLTMPIHSSNSRDLSQGVTPSAPKKRQIETTKTPRAARI